MERERAGSPFLFQTTHCAALVHVAIRRDVHAPGELYGSRFKYGAYNIEKA